MVQRGPSKPKGRTNAELFVQGGSQRGKSGEVIQIRGVSRGNYGVEFNRKGDLKQASQTTYVPVLHPPPFPPGRENRDEQDGRAKHQNRKAPCMVKYETSDSKPWEPMHGTAALLDTDSDACDCILQRGRRIDGTVPKGTARDAGFPGSNET